MDKKRLYRTEGQFKMVCGVCGGIAEYFDIDPPWSVWAGRPSACSAPSLAADPLYYRSGRDPNKKQRVSRLLRPRKIASNGQDQKAAQPPFVLSFPMRSRERGGLSDDPDQNIPAGGHTPQRELWQLASGMTGPMWTTSTTPIINRSGCPAGGGRRGPGHDCLV